MNKYLLLAVLLMAFMYSSAYSQRDPDRDRQKVNEPERDKPRQEILEDRRQPSTMPKGPDRERPTSHPVRPPYRLPKGEDPQPTSISPPANTVPDDYVEVLPMGNPSGRPGSCKIDQKYDNASFAEHNSISRADALKASGICAINNKEYTCALQCFTNALMLHPTDLELYNYRGYVLVVLEEYEYAIEDLDYFLSFVKLDKDAFYNRGLAKFFLNRKKEAYNDLQKASDLGDKRAKSILKYF